MKQSEYEKLFVKNYLEKQKDFKSDYEIRRDYGTAKLTCKKLSEEKFKLVSDYSNYQMCQYLLKKHVRGLDLEKAFKYTYLPFSDPVTSLTGQAKYLPPPPAGPDGLDKFVEWFYINPVCKQVSGGLHKDQPIVVRAEEMNLFFEVLLLLWGGGKGIYNADSDYPPWLHYRWSKNNYIAVTNKPPCSSPLALEIQRFTNLLSYGEKTRIDKPWKVYSVGTNTLKSFREYFKDYTVRPFDYPQIIHYLKPTQQFN